jgi:hypothetical protein
MYEIERFLTTTALNDTQGVSVFICILNFIKIRWQITEILRSKVLAETPVYNEFHRSSETWIR